MSKELISPEITSALIKEEITNPKGEEPLSKSQTEKVKRILSSLLPRLAPAIVSLGTEIYGFAKFTPQEINQGDPFVIGAITGIATIFALLGYRRNRDKEELKWNPHSLFRKMKKEKLIPGDGEIEEVDLETIECASEILTYSGIEDNPFEEKEDTVLTIVTPINDDIIEELLNDNDERENLIKMGKFANKICLLYPSRKARKKALYQYFNKKELPKTKMKQQMINIILNNINFFEKKSLKFREFIAFEDFSFCNNQEKEILFERFMEEIRQINIPYTNLVDLYYQDRTIQSAITSQDFMTEYSKSEGEDTEEISFLVNRLFRIYYYEYKNRDITTFEEFIIDILNSQLFDEYEGIFELRSRKSKKFKNLVNNLFSIHNPEEYDDDHAYREVVDGNYFENAKSALWVLLNFEPSPYQLPDRNSMRIEKSSLEKALKILIIRGYRFEEEDNYIPSGKRMKLNYAIKILREYCKKALEEDPEAFSATLKNAINKANKREKNLMKERMKEFVSSATIAEIIQYAYIFLSNIPHK
jgi:hypothetical protein